MTIQFFTKVSNMFSFLHQNTTNPYSTSIIFKLKSFTKLEKTVAAGFEAKPLETVATDFKAKPAKIIRDKPLTLVLRLNQKICASSLHVPGADRTRHHPTSRPSDHRVPDLCDHPRSFAPGLLLLSRSSSLHIMPHLPLAHHETNKHDSPNKTKVKEKQNETVQI
jgi:hypothetical protein